MRKINKSVLAGLVVFTFAASFRNPVCIPNNYAATTTDSAGIVTTEIAVLNVNLADTLVGPLTKSSVDSPPSPVSDADHVQLTRLLIEVVWRVDHGKARTVYELFTNDGELDVVTKQVGRDAIRSWGVALDNRKDAVHHVVGNSRFTQDGPNRARGTSTLTVYQKPAGAGVPTLPVVALGEDQDEFVRTAQGWRFKSRKWVSFSP